MASVLCYGDSNTWGYDPKEGKRYPREARWTGVLQELLGQEWQVVEEGLCGRTVAFATASEPEVNGLAYLPACLKSHAPLEWMVLMLGTNDLQLKFFATPLEIARGLERMVQLVLSPYSHGLGPVPKLLIVAPPVVGPGIRRFFLRELFGGEACIDRSRQLAKRTRAVALQYQCAFLDAGEVAEACLEDGLHLDVENHRRLAEAIANRING